jgi:hypothetical protein
MLDQRAVGQARPAAESPAGKVIPAKGVVSSDMNLLNIGLAFDADLSKCRTEGERQKLLVLASVADPARGKPRLRL